MQIRIGGVYWAIMPVNNGDGDFNYDPEEPYQVVVEGNQLNCEDLWGCHVAGNGEYSAYVGCRTEDLFETYAEAAAAFRKEIGDLAGHLMARAVNLRELAATFPDDQETRKEQVRKELAEAEAHYLSIERGRNEDLRDCCG